MPFFQSELKKNIGLPDQFKTCFHVCCLSCYNTLLEYNKCLVIFKWSQVYLTAVES